MSSREHSRLLDLDRGLPTTPEDVAALRRARERSALDMVAFLRALASLPQPRWETLRARPGPHGEPFELTSSGVSRER